MEGRNMYSYGILGFGKEFIARTNWGLSAMLESRREKNLGVAHCPQVELCALQSKMLFGTANTETNEYSTTMW